MPLVRGSPHNNGMMKQPTNRLESTLAEIQTDVLEPKEGAQSKVFDHGDFVLKLPVPPEEMLVKAQRHPWFQETRIDEVRIQHTHGIEHHRAVERFLANCPELRRLCADFTLLEDDQVRQRKVNVLDHLGDESRRHEHEGELKRLIDDFAVLHVALWRQGSCELECSAFTNCGRDRTTDELLLIDVGNLSFKFDEAVESVGVPLSAERAREYMETDKKARDGERLPDWFKRGQLREWFFKHAPTLFDYYALKMSSTMTQEALKVAWNSASQMA
jgi:hypothetical protein